MQQQQERQRQQQQQQSDITALMVPNSPTIEMLRPSEDGFLQVLKELKAGLKRSSDQTTARRVRAE